MLACIDIAKAAGLGVAIPKGREVAFRCPRHDDKHPSLLINCEKDCWMRGPCGKSGTPWALAAFLGGCDPNDKNSVKEWLKSHGLVNGNPTSSKGKSLPRLWQRKPIKCWYHYQDYDETWLYSVARIESFDDSGKRLKEFPICVRRLIALKKATPNSGPSKDDVWFRNYANILQMASNGSGSWFLYITLEPWNHTPKRAVPEPCWNHQNHIELTVRAERDVLCDV